MEIRIHKERQMTPLNRFLVVAALVPILLGGAQAAQAQSAPRNLSDPAPLSRHDFEHLAHQLLRRLVPLLPYRAAILD